MRTIPQNPSIYDRFMVGLDANQPDWFVIYATQQELADHARATTDGRSGTVAAKAALRRNVCSRLFSVLRSGMSAGIVEAVVETDVHVAQMVEQR
jgi:hypothetical protein